MSALALMQSFNIAYLFLNELIFMWPVTSLSVCVTRYQSISMFYSFSTKNYLDYIFQGPQNFERCGFRRSRDF